MYSRRSTFRKPDKIHPKGRKIRRKPCLFKEKK